jgi:HNH endonuclease
VSELGEVAASFRAELAAFDASALTGAECAGLLDELAAARKACEATEAVVAARAAASGAHRRAGYAAAHDWLAAVAGTTAHDARLALEAVVEVEVCPQTRDALVNGRVSMAQAREIVHTEMVAPGNEASLLELAEGAGLRRVRDVARELRAAAIDPDELYARQRAARSFVHWRDELGMVCIRASLMPEDGIALVNRVEARGRRHRRDSRTIEPFEASAADALAEIVAGGGGRARPPDLVLVCDIAAWMRGHGHPGEVVKIVGGGPLPVSVVQALSEHAFYKVVLHDGIQVQTVAHYGRSLPARVRTALELGFPPDFDGAVCSEEGCDRRHDLEWDHDDPLANGGPTNVSNLKAQCQPDHRSKTERDRAAGLLGGRSP